MLLAAFAAAAGWVVWGVGRVVANLVTALASHRFSEKNARRVGWAAGWLVVVVGGAGIGYRVGGDPAAGAAGAALLFGIGWAFANHSERIWVALRGPRRARTDRGLDRELWEEARQVCFRSKGRLCLIGLRCCTGVATEVDHIVPLARGGSKYDQSNLQPSCGPCNRSKGTKAMSQLRRRRPVTDYPKRLEKLLQP